LCHVFKKKKNGEWIHQESPVIHVAKGNLNPCTENLPSVSLVDYEAGFHSVGLANPNNHKIINYFWWGALTSTSKTEHLDNAFLAVNRVAALLKDKGFTIRYYFQTTATALSNSLHLDIEQITIGNGGTLATPGDILAGTDLDHLGPTINALIGSFEHYGAKTYAGIKDILMLCILYANGGYFFDTNVRADGNVNGYQLASALTKFGKDRGIPAYPHLYDKVEVLRQTTEDCMYFVDTNGVIDQETPVPKFPKMEFNGAFMPKGHPVAREAILQYLLHAKQKGLVTGGQSTVATVHKDWTSGQGSFKRNVGTLIRWAVCSSLLKFAQFTPVTTSDFLWEIERKSGGLLFVPFRLFKQYGNIWRKDLEAYLQSLEESVAMLTHD